MAEEYKSNKPDKALAARLDIEFALKAARLGVWEMDLVTTQIIWDERCRELYGLTQNNPMTYAEAIQFIHPDDAGRVDEAIKLAMVPQLGGYYDATYRTIGADDGILRWVRFTGEVSFAEDQKVSRFAGVAQDVTKDELARQLTISEERFRTTVEQAPVAMALFSGTDFVITLANERVLEYWGRRREQVMNKPLFEALPEASGQGFEELLTNVYTTGERFVAKELTVMLERNGELQRTYIDFVYEAYREPDGRISGVMVTCFEITDQVVARQKVAQSEAQFRTLIEEAPVATCLFVGREFRIDVINEAMVSIFGKGPSVFGKPLAEALPELQGQHFLQTIDEVFTTGKTYATKADRAELVIDGKLTTFYFDYTYKPLRNANGEVYAIVEMATDVTAEVLMKQKIQESETYFRNLIDTAPAIIWETEPDGYCSYLNKRWYELTGQTQDEARGFGWLDATHPDDIAETSRLFQEANAQQKLFNALYRLRQADGTYRWAVDKGSPRFTADGTYEGLIGTVVDVHEQIVASQQLAEQEAQFKNVTNSSPTGLWLANESGELTYLNKTLIDWTGLSRTDLLGAGWANALIDEDRERSVDVFLTAVAARAHYDTRFRLRKADGSAIWCQAAGDPYYHPDGSYAGYAGFCIDIDELVRSREVIHHSELKFRSLLAQAPVALSLMRGPDYVIDLANERALALWDKTSEAVLNKPFAQALPEIYEQGFGDIVADVFRTGEPFIANQMPVMVSKNGVLRSIFVNATIEPIRDLNGHIEAVLEVGYEVTEQVTAQQELAQQKIYLQNAIDIANLGTFSIDLVTNIGSYSEAIRDWFGLDSLSQPMSTIFNKVHPDDQALVERALTSEQDARHDIVYRISHPHSDEMRYLRSIGKQLVSNGIATSITGIIQDVTPQVLVQQRIQESQQRLLSSFEAAPVGIAVIGRDQLTFKLVNPAYAKLVDRHVDQLVSKPLLEAIPELQGQGFDLLLDNILATGVPYTANEISAQLMVGGQLSTVYFNTTYQPLYETGSLGDGPVTSILAVALDVTEQVLARQKIEESEQRYRNLSADLDEQIQQRTQELQATVRDLERSNDNLQQFAYVASHDLQEPLRKIQAFGNILNTQYASQLGDGADYLQRMQSAATRMSVLIKDLLTYSRISTQQEITNPVPLGNVVKTVLSDLDLIIAETEAVVTVTPLPTIQGDKSQLGQLFQNLISNALKFRRSGVIPEVHITAAAIPADSLPPVVRPMRLTNYYYRIDVTDNGIGFDEKYLGRIFQVFQRLHGRNEFAGTGIGLAICEKVAANHGGAITASSKPGEGATFSVYLPV
ncbi:PAS domain S-box protein [Fibrella sp. HMF5335]|uniref:histidine kinase n=1 Tax=Fibrella rubiginis TaxID=2817060 RepID=A0A939GH07_9BACT|nr:PAS domain S-box protein [Fibrella rubiginis]MBO0937295.1 PAS domain S-box protein [Fibrella rubiginis]